MSSRSPDFRQDAPDRACFRMRARLEALALMNEALAILDGAAVDSLVGAKLQGAVDALVEIDTRELTGGVSVPPAIATHFADGLASAERGTLRHAIDALTVPAYATDAEGKITYWNTQCVALAGREPELGSDKWCVTWKLYTTAGERLPHDRCPMAVAILEQREVRGEVAIAERPDGRRIAFTPYPTPVFNSNGQLTGAINVLIDVSKAQQLELRYQSDLCRRLARSIADPGVSASMKQMADNFQSSAESLAR